MCLLPDGTFPANRKLDLWHHVVLHGCTNASQKSWVVFQIISLHFIGMPYCCPGSIIHETSLLKNYLYRSILAEFFK